jgi:hypothetical protein
MAGQLYIQVLSWSSSLDLQLPEQSVPITTKDESSNTADGAVYSIQYYVIKFVSAFVTGRWFSPDTPISSTNKTECHYITEILLKVAFNTISPTLTHTYW